MKEYLLKLIKEIEDKHESELTELDLYDIRIYSCELDILRSIKC